MQSLIQELGYEKSSHFLKASEASAFGAQPYSHLCRKLGKRLQGIYAVTGEGNQASTPLVAVCQAQTNEEAREIHSLVWNQDFVPFVLVESPQSIRLYSGFQYRSGAEENKNSGFIVALNDFNQISEVLEGFSADEIDNGELWNKWGKHVDPDKRVDWHLLNNLEKLGKQLREDGLDGAVCNALIGRFVYLRYLLDRDFLSDRKLEKWDLSEEQVFSRNATLTAFKELNKRLDSETDGLNGAIFPFTHRAIKQSHLRTVASAFKGDDPESGQMVFDFAAYDFSFIPIETLSVVYEQFLHTPKANGKSKAREQGAYYTPIPLVNYMVAEMDSRLRLAPSMKVLDPSAGSGAFLVQTYRMLIERAIREKGKNLNPTQLRDILTKQIFGIDRDQDACRIAEMSLLITLLDYVDPPDLEGKFHNFLLPTLRNRNIIEADFFDPKCDWVEIFNFSDTQIFDWVVGNPPWIEVSKPFKDDRDKFVFNWINSVDSPPVGGNQVAEAFVWKSQRLIREKGIAGFVLPAMTLFKDESKGFREELFGTTNVWNVANFANLNYVLFSGRTIVPVMSLFFEKPSDEKVTKEPILTFSPFVVNQIANRPESPGKQKNSWNVVINGTELKEVPWKEAVRGDPLTWKLAMWGNHHDRNLLNRLATRFKSFGLFCDENQISIAQGIEFRKDPIAIEVVSENGGLRVTNVDSNGPGEKAGLKAGDLIVQINGETVSELGKEVAERMLYGGAGSKVKKLQKQDRPNINLQFAGEKLEHHPSLAGKQRVHFDKLKGIGKILSFPEKASSTLSKENCWVRKGRAIIPISISTPPHIIVDVARRFAVLNEDRFLAVPARQIGIASENKAVMKAIALYLSSDFARYHQFFHSTQWGVEHSISTLRVLKKLPIPLESKRLINSWAKEYSTIQQETPVDEPISIQHQARINSLVSSALKLDKFEQSLVEDFLSVRLLSVQGKFSKGAVSFPDDKEDIAPYLTTLRDILDDYMEDEDSPASHDITAVCDEKSGMIEIVLREGKPTKPKIRHAQSHETEEFRDTRKRLLKKHRQWLYVNRSLELYRDGRLYLFKPLERQYWTKRQAIIDAGELISQALTG